MNFLNEWSWNFWVEWDVVGVEDLEKEKVKQKKEEKKRNSKCDGGEEINRLLILICILKIFVLMFLIEEIFGEELGKKVREGSKESEKIGLCTKKNSFDFY